MKTSWKGYFDFRKHERNGIVTLLFILACVIASPAIYKKYMKKTPVDFSAFDKEVAAFIKENSHFDSAGGRDEPPEMEPVEVAGVAAGQYLHPFPFNPNTMPASQWKALGLKDRQVKIIQNYFAKGGRLRKKEDFRKIYGISEAEYRTLEPFIQLPGVADDSSQKPGTPAGRIYPHKPEVSVELNTADSMDLLQVKGIGPATARGIIRLRNRLGGFARREQLLEIYGMDTARYRKMSASLTADPSRVKKINLNKAGIKELVRHPYFEFYLAKAIVTYREKHGPFNKVEEIRQIDVVYKELYDKISPYLSVED